MGEIFIVSWPDAASYFSANEFMPKICVVSSFHQRRWISVELGATVGFVGRIVRKRIRTCT
jgi:hypothetical protein